MISRGLAPITPVVIKGFIKAMGFDEDKVYWLSARSTLLVLVEHDGLEFALTAYMPPWVVENTINALSAEKLSILLSSVFLNTRLPSDLDFVSHAKEMWSSGVGSSATFHMGSQPEELLLATGRSDVNEILDLTRSKIKQRIKNIYSVVTRDHSYLELKVVVDLGDGEVTVFA